MRKLKFAVVGCGQIARERMIPAILNSEKAELVALVDVDQKVVRDTADLCNIRHYSSNLKDVFDKDLVDAVYVSAPNYLHCDITVKAAAAGKHVLCEKPMATNLDDGKRMIESCKKNGVKFMVAYMSRFNEANVKAKKLIAEGIIGKPTIIKSEFAFVKAHRSNNDWRLDPKRAGGGCLYDIGVYPIDFVNFLLDEQIVEVMAITGNIRFNYSVEDTVIASFKLSKGAMGDLVCGYCVKIPSTFEVYGTEGSLILKEPFNQYPNAKLQLNCGDREEKYQVGLNTAPFACYQREVEYFCECVEQNKEPIPNGEVGLYAIKVIDAIYKSAQSRKSVVVTKDI